MFLKIIYFLYFMRIPIPYILFLVLVFSCKDNSNKQEINITKSATKVLNPYVKDSLRLSHILKKALHNATVLINESNVDTLYVVGSTKEENAMDVTVELSLDTLFSKQHRHLKIRRSTVSDTYLNVYMIKNASFVEKVAHEQLSMSYINDSIVDINGDEVKDLLVYSYSSTGCCMRNLYAIYLYDIEANEFSHEYSFLNPTFSPKEKLIRGFGYGRSGTVDLYKREWKGFDIDTLESISSLRSPLDGKKVSDTLYRFNKKGEIIEKLLELPKEYQNINGIEWYLGNL